MIFTVTNILLCFSLAFLCFTSTRGRHTFYLGSIFCILSIKQAASLEVANSFLAYAPILWVPETLLLLIPPLLVCYIRSLSGASNHLYTKCLLIPSGMYVKAFSYFYVAGYVKPESFHTSGLFYGGTVEAIIFSFVTATWFLVWIHKNRDSIQLSSFYWIQALLAFLIVYSIAGSIEWSASYFYNIDRVLLIQWFIDGTMFVFLATLLVKGLSLLLNPIMLMPSPSVKEEKPWEESIAIADVSSNVTPKKELCPKVREAYVNRIREVLEVKKVYLNSKITLSQLAKSIDVSPHDLSYIINNEWNLNFNELINSYRVNEAKKLLEEETYDTATMFAIAIDSGFNSESSFYTVFKKVTGKSPKRYRDAVKSTSEL